MCINAERSQPGIVLLEVGEIGVDRLALKQPRLGHGLRYKKTPGDTPRVFNQTPSKEEIC